MRVWRTVVFWISARDRSYPWAIPRGTINDWVVFAVYIVCSITSWLEIYVISFINKSCSVCNTGCELSEAEGHFARPDLEGGIWGREATPRGMTVGGTPLWHVSSPASTVLHQVDHWIFLSTTPLYLHGLLAYLERGTLFSRLVTVKQWFLFTKSPEPAHKSTPTDTQICHKPGHREWQKYNGKIA